MKRLHSFFICIAAMALLAGCSKKSGSTDTANVATNGFGGYVKQMAAEQKTANKTIDLTALNQAVQLFNVQEGRYPKDLQELVSKNYMPKIPDAPYGYTINYNADNGTVTVDPQK